MTENQRESFRIGPDAGLEVELLRAGRSIPCELVNLSAGGAKVTTAVALEPGEQCTLTLQLGRELRTQGKTAVVRLPMEVLDGSGSTVRLRSTSASGSPEYEAATRLLLEAQRLQRARKTGTDDASPMVSDEERRARLRRQDGPRFSKGSLRPGSDS